MHAVAEVNISETKTLKPMLERVLEQFQVEHMIIMVVRGLLSLDNIDHTKA